MTEIGLLITAALVFAYALVAHGLSVSIVAPPLVFLAAGYGLQASGLIQADVSASALHLLAEVTLIVVLFSDAAIINLRVLRRDHAWPVRTLLLGMPGVVVLGTGVALIAFPSWTVWEAALLAAILAPTDAALGQAVVSIPAVPERVRRALIVESGLNDGLALPLILFLGSAAAGGQEQNAHGNWLLFAVTQIGIGTLAGGAAGAAGGWLMRRAAGLGWASGAFEGIAVLALAGLCYLLAVAVGGNGFVAAFVGGLAFGHSVAGRCRFVFEFMETEGQALVLATFLLIGAALLPAALDAFAIATFVVIAASLFLARPAAIWLSLAGTDAAPVTRLFIGWFGPRGLATALFALFVVGEIEGLKVGQTVLSIAIAAVAASALLHGLSAAPAARWYGRRVGRIAEGAEHLPIEGSARPIRALRRALRGTGREPDDTGREP